MRRLVGLLLLFSACALAQAPRAYFPWWENPISQRLNLSQEQRDGIRSILRDYRSRMIDQRAAVEKAEAEVQELFNEDISNDAAAGQIIDNLVAARADLTRSLTQMSLNLRKVLTGDQWQKLQRAQRSGLIDRLRDRDLPPEQRRPPRAQRPAPRQRPLQPNF